MANLEYPTTLLKQYQADGLVERTWGIADPDGARGLVVESSVRRAAQQANISATITRLFAARPKTLLFVPGEVVPEGEDVIIHQATRSVSGLRLRDLPLATQSLEPEYREFADPQTGIRSARRMLPEAQTPELRDPLTYETKAVQAFGGKCLELIAWLEDIGREDSTRAPEEVLSLAGIAA